MVTMMCPIFAVVIIVAAVGQGSGVVKNMPRWRRCWWSRLGRGEWGGGIGRRGKEPKMPATRIGAVMAGRRRGTRMVEVGKGLFAIAPF